MCPQEWRPVVGVVPLSAKWGHCCISKLVFPCRTPRSWCTRLPQIYPVLFMVAGRAPLLRETLVKGLGTIFCSHTRQRPFKVQVSMPPHTRSIEKRRKHGKKRDRLGFRSCGCCTVLSPEANEYDKFLPTQFADKFPNQSPLSQDFALVVHLSSLH